mgnify:CR=1 FL=1
MYLGRQYRLKVYKFDDDKVKLKGKFICLYSSKERCLEHNKKLLYIWYNERAKKRFYLILEQLMERLQKYNIEKPMELKKYQYTAFETAFSKLP